MGIIKTLNERKEIPFLLLIVLVSILLSGYSFGIKDQGIQIPFAKFYADNSLYPNDITVIQSNFLYSVFLPLMGFLGNILSIEFLFFVLFFISKFLFVLMVFYITTLLFKNKNIGYIASFLFLLNKPAFGGITIFDELFLGRVLIMFLVLLSIYLFLKNKYLLSFFLLGISFLFHPLSAIFVIFMYTFYFVVVLSNSIKKEKSKLCKDIVKPYLAFFATISPLLIWKFLLPAPMSIANFSEWIYLLKLRLGHHFFPFSWYSNLLSNSPIYFGILFFIGLIVLAYFMVKSFQSKPENKEHHSKILIMSVASFILLIIGILFIEIIQIRYITNILVNLQLQRSFQFFAMFFLIYFANFSYNFLNKLKQQKTFARIIFPFVFIGAFFGLKLVDKAYFLSIGLFSVLFFIFYLNNIKDKSKYFVKVLTLMVLATTFCFIIQNSTSHLNFPFIEKQDSWIDVQKWANNNTNKADLFLVPPDKENFRIYSERPSYGGWYDGTYLFLNQPYAFEWYDRMKDINCTTAEKLLKLSLETCNENYHNLGAEKLKSLSTKYNISYVIYEKQYSLNLKKVYENQEYSVYSFQN